MEPPAYQLALKAIGETQPKTLANHVLQDVSFAMMMDSTHAQNAPTSQDQELSIINILEQTSATPLVLMDSTYPLLFLITVNLVVPIVLLVKLPHKTVPLPIAQ